MRSGRKNPKPAVFKTSASLATIDADVGRCMERWGVADYQVIQNRRDKIAEINFEKAGDRYRVRCSSSPDFASNLRACYLEINRARLAEERGISTVRESLGQYLALPAGTPAVVQETPWQVLRIPEGSDQETITKAYRRLARVYHPDDNPGDDDAAAEFRRITEAYRALTKGV